jgi:anti-sigma B factor antagonist
MPIVIDKQLNGTELTISLKGRLDTITSMQLEQELRVSLTGVKSLRFDLDELEYISSAGLRVLLVAQRQMNKLGSMRIENANDVIKEIFNMTGFSNIMTIV